MQGQLQALQQEQEAATADGGADGGDGSGVGDKRKRGDDSGDGASPAKVPKL
jgi:hypothetical protein